MRIAVSIIALCATLGIARADCPAYVSNREEFLSWAKGPSGLSADAGCNMLTKLKTLSGTCNLPANELAELTYQQHRWCVFAKNGLRWRGQFFAKGENTE